MQTLNKSCSSLIETSNDKIERLMLETRKNKYSLIFQVQKVQKIVSRSNLFLLLHLRIIIISCPASVLKSKKDLIGLTDLTLI